uniref:50K protein (Fragments) n=1 Tax=Rattus norvegicus TaxID=10116 RepID=Q7M0G6_RAT
ASHGYGGRSAVGFNEMEAPPEGLQVVEEPVYE